MSTDPSIKPPAQRSDETLSEAPAADAAPVVLQADSAALRRGVIALLLGLGIFIWGLTGHAGPFIQGPLYMMILGAFIGIYGAALLVVVLGTRRRLRLSPSELEAWGPALEARREWLLEQLREGARPGELAATLESEDEVPRHVTLRYIIAIGRAALAD